MTLFTILFLVCGLLSPPSSANENRTLTRIALGSCTHQNYPQPIWNAIRKWNPELLLFLGDIIYCDTRDMTQMKAAYEKMNSLPEFRRFRATCPILAIWDDHDYGENDAGAAYPMKAESEALFLDFLDEPAASERRQRPGIYNVYYYGPPEQRVQIILLDTRYFRSAWVKDPSKKKRYKPATDPGLTMLGETQWQWLEEQLQQPAQFRIIASGVQIINDEHGYECWGNFPREQTRLFDLIRQTRASGVFFISGDRHFSELSVTDGGIGYPIYDFTSSGMTHSAVAGINFPNSKRVGTAYGNLSFGTIEIDWKPDPIIQLRMHDVKGHLQFDYHLKLSQLQIPKHSPGGTHD